MLVMLVDSRSFRLQDIAQRMMLATWLVEFYLSKCNELDDIVAAESVSGDVENLRTEKTILEDDLRQFLDTYKVAPFLSLQNVC